MACFTSGFPQERTVFEWLEDAAERLRVGRRWRRRLTKRQHEEPWRLDADGMLPIPAMPGLGVRLDPDALARYTGGARLLDD